jgi:hypothetical protein
LYVKKQGENDVLIVALYVDEINMHNWQIVSTTES